MRGASWAPACWPVLLLPRVATSPPSSSPSWWPPCWRRPWPPACRAGPWRLSPSLSARQGDAGCTAREDRAMPIATPEIYAAMLDRAKAGAFAYPAINVTSSQGLNAALMGFAEAESDGIVQISTGGAEFLSGAKVKDMVVGASALAEFAHVVAGGWCVHNVVQYDTRPEA